ncbi:MAG: hypothetical protein U1C33_04860, partial [Candidatus Cloacimonadaceae bacterium]|nr:hypothetical protein [Candidatus Cloacimonadaceae bacterium]
LYVMANGKSLHRFNADDLKKNQQILALQKMGSFDLLYEGRLGIIDGKSQNLLIYNDGLLEHKYFSANSKGTFPFFSAITNISYNAELKELRICDAKSSFQRSLRFFYSPDEPQWIKLIVRNDRIAELSWDPGNGIKQWSVYESTDRDTSYYKVTQPRMTLVEPRTTVSRYRVSALAEDNKVGPPSAEIEDYYTYARYLKANNNFPQAAVAFKRALNMVEGKLINDEIADTYLLESRANQRHQEFESALRNLVSARAAVGNRKDLIIESINIYKIMKAFGDGIRYIKQDSLENDPDIHRQLISLYYLNNNIDDLIKECITHLKDNPSETTIIKYLIFGYEQNENYEQAISAQNNLLAFED